MSPLGRALLALGVCLAPFTATAQRSAPAEPDSGRADSARAQHLHRIVVSGARLAPVADVRLPVRAEHLPLGQVPFGASTATELLQRVPGVSVANDQGSRAQPTLDLRGFTLSPVVGVPQGVSVFLDGVRVNEPDAQEVNFDLLPMEVIESAELLPGASAVFGKNTLAGSLNLRTMRGSGRPQLRTSLSVGAFGERAAHLVASGQHDGIDGLVMLKGSTEDGYQVQSGAETRQLFATVGRRSDSADAAVSLLLAHDQVHEAGSLPESWLPVARRANYTGGDFFRPDLVQLSARLSRPIGDARLRATAFARRNAIEQLNINAGAPNTHAFVRNQSAGATAELSFPASAFGRPLDLTVGGEAAHSWVSYRVFSETNTDVPTLPPDCDATSSAAALCEDARVNGDDAGLYAQGILDATSRLSFLVSARGDYARVPFTDLREPAFSGTSTFWRLSPRLGLTYAAGSGARVYASVGSAFRAPAPLELACASADAACPLPFSLGADPPLDPVVAWNYEVGADWAPRAGTLLAGSLWVTDVRNEIVFVSAERAAGYFQNVARTRREGAELSFSTLLPAGARVFGSYTFVDATYRTVAALASALDDNVVTPGSRFAMSPRHRATLGVQVARSLGAVSLDGTLSARAASSSFLRGDEANHTAPLPGYAVADLRVSARWQRVVLGAFLANVFDRRYEIFGVYAENPRGPFGGPPPASPSVERFLTPAYPRTLSVSVGVEP